MAALSNAKNPLRSTSLYVAAILYMALVAITVHYHEPWADEAQAWLLGRDSNLFELWTRLLHYEGTPGLWHTLLHLLTSLGIPYEGLSLVSATLGCAAVALLLWKSPLPLAARLLLPFTYFLCYQYSVIARSYSLLPVLIFSCAIVQKGPQTRIATFTVLLCLLAAVSVHAFVLSTAVWSAFHLPIVGRWASINVRERKRYVVAGLVYAAVLTLLAFSALPAKDVAFPFQIELSWTRFRLVGAFLLSEGFAGVWFVSLAVVALSIRFLWKGGALLVFLLSIGLLWAVSSIVYLQYWHVGIVFLTWIFSLWWAARNARLDIGTALALTVMIPIQCYWTARSVAYDCGSPYSGSRSAAQFLAKLDMTRTRPYCVGYSCTAIQPYFPHNVFANLNEGREAAYWDWSSRNRAVNPEMFLRDENPEYVVVGFKTPAEAVPWASMMKTRGYRTAAHFDGHLFWRTHQLEPESYDVYQRTAGVPDTEGLSVVSLSDPKAEWQLRRGFYGLESNAWRWTAREFSATLKGSDDRAFLVLRLVIPETQIQKLGPMTLTADIGGQRLAPETFSQAGSFNYSREIPKAARRSGSVTVNFSFDKATPPSSGDARELSAIVSEIGLYPKRP